MTEQFDFYVMDGPPESEGSEGRLPQGYELRVFRPSPFRLRCGKHGNLWLYLTWYWLSRYGYKIYYVWHDRRMVHWSHVLSRNFRMAFLGAEDREIGPSWTCEEFRGRGIFPAVLREIVSREQIAGRWFVFARSDNHASKRAIEKAGFRRAGTGRRYGLWRVYRCDAVRPLDNTTTKVRHGRTA
jgi:hypothetical protein